MQRLQGNLLARFGHPSAFIGRDQGDAKSDRQGRAEAESILLPQVNPPANLPRL